MYAHKSSSVRKLINLFSFVALLTACAGNAQTNTSPKGVASGCPYKLPWSASLGKILVTQGYAEPGNASHTTGSGMDYAIDFALPGGTPVLAARAGTVSKIHDGETVYGGSRDAAKANFVIIDHGDGTFAIYMHLEKTVFTKTDEGKTKVAQGQVIGYSGRTGWTNGHYHLHFQLQKVGDHFGQSIPLCFTETDNGTPQLNKSYLSQNGTGLVLGISVTVTSVPTKTMVPTPLPADWWPDSLIGTWKGDASCRFHSGPYQDCPIITVEFQIQRKDDGHLVAKDLVRTDVPQAPQGEHQAMLEENNLFYCFTIDMGAFCFYPVNENTLDYIGGSMDYSEKGTLTRQSENPLIGIWEEHPNASDKGLVIQIEKAADGNKLKAKWISCEKCQNIQESYAREDFLCFNDFDDTGNALSTYCFKLESPNTLVLETWDTATDYPPSDRKIVTLHRVN